MNAIWSHFDPQLTSLIFMSMLSCRLFLGLPTQRFTRRLFLCQYSACTCCSSQHAQRTAPIILNFTVLTTSMNNTEMNNFKSWLERNCVKTPEESFETSAISYSNSCYPSLSGSLTPSIAPLSRSQCVFVSFCSSCADEQTPMELYFS